MLICLDSFYSFCAFYEFLFCFLFLVALFNIDCNLSCSIFLFTGVKVTRIILSLSLSLGSWETLFVGVLGGLSKVVFLQRGFRIPKPSGRRHDPTWNSISSRLEGSGTLGWVWIVVPNHVRARLRLRVLKRSCVYFWFGPVVVTIVFLSLSQGWFGEVYFCGTDCMHRRRSRQGHSCLFIVFLLVYAHLSSLRLPTAFPYAATILICFVCILDWRVYAPDSRLPSMWPRLE